MLKRAQLMSLAAFSAISFYVPGFAKADGMPVPLILADAGGSVQEEPRIQSCAEASKDAWFHRQLELSDGDLSPFVQVPAECQRSLIAQHGDE